MKRMKKHIILFVACIFISCSSNKESVTLTDFTKELIAMYINDTDNSEVKINDEIILISTTDTLYYYLSIFSNNSKLYNFCREDFIGQTSYFGHLIRVFGDENSNFFIVNDNVSLKKCYSNNVTEYDPDIWQICFYKKNLSLSEMRTFKVEANGDISIIKNIVEKYFSVSEVNTEVDSNEIYQWYEVEESPKFSLVEDSLRHIIDRNLKIKQRENFAKVPIVIHIIVDKNGNATLSEVIQSSNNEELDNEALRIIEIICQYKFVPAFHRGQNVNATYSVIFK